MGEALRRIAAAGPIAAVLALAACAGTPPVATPTREVAVGTCRDKTTAEEMVGISDVSPAVPCTSPHTLETYALATADASVAALGPERPGPEMLTASSPATCPAGKVRPYLGGTALDTAWGVVRFVKFPTRAEWAGGERTVVCDLVVPAAAGVVPRISVPLRNALRYDDSARLRLCRAGGDGSAELGCDRPHAAERAGAVPARGTAASRAAACAAQARGYAGRLLPKGFVPTVTTDGRTAECWIARLTGTSTGTLRGGLERRP